MRRPIRRELLVEFRRIRIIWSRPCSQEPDFDVSDTGAVALARDEVGGARRGGAAEGGEGEESEGDG